MCRIFFSLFSPNLKPKIYEFLKQSNRKYKNTPGIDNYRDQTNNLDGFGFAYIHNLKWNIYKKPIIYLQDPRFINKLAYITQSLNNICIGHIRQKSYGESTIFNTHPFIYENQVFMQNGYIKDFNIHKLELLNYVHPYFHNKINGDTDTELLFFMFLTIYKDQCNKNCTKRRKCQISQILFNSIQKLFNVFKKLKIEISANIIYADDIHVVITRYLHYNRNAYTQTQYPLSLYYNNDDGITISSEPIYKNNNILISENTMIIMNYSNIKKFRENIMVYTLE